MISITNLSFTYEGEQVPTLQDLNFTIKKGEYIALIGSNGSGKTTLIRHLNALLLPSIGEVRVNGLNTRDTKNHREIRRQVGLIFQNPDNQIVGMSVEEDVAFGPCNLGLPAHEVHRRVNQALATAGLGGMEKRLPHTLSGGQKQLLALAGLLALEPQLIVLDEPTSSLDPVSKSKVLALLQKLKSQGIGIIYVTHSMEEASQADRVMVMDRGKIIADGRPANVLNRVVWLKALGLAPPRVTELMWQLQQRGEDVETGIFSLEEAINEITALLARRRATDNKDISGKAGYYV